MNKLFIIIPSFLLIAFIGFGQYDSKGEEKSRFRPGAMWYFTGLRPAVVEKVRKYDRLIVDLTYNDWIGDQAPFQNHWASIGFNTNFVFDIPLSKGNTVALGLGIAHQFVAIRHNNHLIADESLGTTSYFAKSSSDNFDKSVLAGNSFALPIELRFRKESWRHFKLHIGGRIGYQANLYSKYVTNQNGVREINKRIGFPDQNNLLYGAHMRLGLRNWALFGAYYFNPIFKNSNSIQVNHLQFGVSVSLF